MKFRNAARGVRTIFMAEKFELTTALIMAAMVIAVQFARVTETYGYSAETDALRIESIGLMMIGGVIAIIGFIFAVQGTQDASRNEPVFRNTLPWLIVGIVGILAGCVLKTLGTHAFSFCFTLGRIGNVMAAYYVLTGISAIATRMGSTEVSRKTKETDIHIKVNLDGTGKCDIQTGLGFFDHMLEQIGKHGMMDLMIHTKGDLEVDEHHTIEDTAIALGECILTALGDKRGIERYGYCLPMDDCLCSVALDFGGRPWLVWDATFKREKIGEMPTEMFLHFFKSLSDAAKMNLNIKAEGENEHHKIEGIFKALARSLKMAVRRDIYHYELPSTKGML